MNATRFFKQSLMALMSLFLVFAISLGGNYKTSTSVTGSGTINVNGNFVNTNGSSTAVAIAPTVRMNGNGGTAQSMEATVAGPINFSTLQLVGTAAKQINTNVGVSTTLTLGDATTELGGGVTFPASHTLTIADASSYRSTSAGVVNFNGGIVSYTKSGGQTVLNNATGIPYGTLNLTQASTYTLGDGGPMAIGTLGASTVTGLTVVPDVTIATSGTIGTLADITGGKSLAYTGTATGSIGYLNNNIGGKLASASNQTITIGEVTKTNGIVEATGGTINFTGTNNLVAGTIEAKTGGIIDFDQAVSGATIKTTGSGKLVFGGSVAAGTAFTISNTSEVTYDQAANGQAIVDASYGTLTLNNGTKTWTLGADQTINQNLAVNAATTIGADFALNVTGNITLGADLTKSANAVKFANAGSSVSSPLVAYEIVGTVTRTHDNDNTASYTFNNSATTIKFTGAPTTGMTFSMTSQPGTEVTGYSLGHSVRHAYTVSQTGFSSGSADVKLGYKQAEASTLGVTETKLKDFQGNILKTNKWASPSNRTTSGASSFGSITYTGKAFGVFASSITLAMDDRFDTFTASTSGSWASTGTWAEGSVPGATDEVVISSAITLDGGASGSAYSATISAGASTSLTVGGTGAGSLAIGAGGLTNSNTNTGLVVNANGSITITGGDFTNDGTLVNDGTITVQ